MYMKKHKFAFFAVLTVCLMLSSISYADFEDNTYDYDVTINYSELTTDDLSGYESHKNWGSQISDWSVSEDAGSNVLKWTTSNFNARNQGLKLNIPLDEPFKASDGVFALEFRAKLPKESAYRWLVNGFMNFETESSKSKADSSALRFGLCQASGTGFQPVINGSAYALLSDIGWGEDSKLLYADYGDKYVTYKFVVDPDAKTFRFYVKPDGDSWSEPYANKNFKNPYTADTTDTFNKGEMPTGNLPAEDIVALSLTSTCIIDNGTTSNVQLDDAKSEKGYYISDVSIRQVNIPVIDSVSLSDGERYFQPDADITVAFKSEINAETVNCDNVYIAKVLSDGSEEAVSQDVYSVKLADDSKTIVLSFDSGKRLDYLTEYRLYVKDIESNGKGRGKLSSPLVVNFRTLTQYEIDVKQFGIENNILKMDYMLSDYVKYTNGNDYVIIASLVQKETNTTYDIKAEIGKSVSDGSDVMDIDNTVEFELPASFEKEDFEIRLYIWNDFVNSVQIYANTGIAIK